MSGPSAPANHILVWMCVLITTNQLGFGSIVPVMALYAALASAAALLMAVALLFARYAPETYSRGRF